MQTPRVRLLFEPGESWLVEFDREAGELLLNPAQLHCPSPATPAGQNVVTQVGVALVMFVRSHPAASDEELAVVALSAAPPPLVAA